MIRTDSFFEVIGEERPANEEILEGVLLAAQKEYEEKKLKYLGNLYANLPFNESVDSRMANMLIKIASELTYRQYVVLYVVNMFQNPAYDAVVKKEPYVLYVLTLKRMNVKLFLPWWCLVSAVSFLSEGGCCSFCSTTPDWNNADLIGIMRR